MDDDLAEVHDEALVDLLPEVTSEELDEADLEGGHLAVEHDAGEVELDLEAHVHVGTVDGGTPPEGEPGDRRWGSGADGGWWRGGWLGGWLGCLYFL